MKKWPKIILLIFLLVIVVGGTVFGLYKSKIFEKKNKDKKVVEKKKKEKKAIDYEAKIFMVGDAIYEANCFKI